MSMESGDDGPRARALRAALDEALGELPGETRAAAPEAVDSAWLGIGLRLGLERPGRARRLLELIADGDPDAADGHPDMADGDPGAAEAPLTERPAARIADGPAPIPARSSLLARAAALSPADQASQGPVVVFGWAAGLTAGEILALGRAVGNLLAGGAQPNAGKGFGLAWDDGVRLPQRHLETMFREFTELEITVGGVLSERDLWTTVEPDPPSHGLGALFGSWVPRKDPREQQAAAAVERNGEAAQRGLVALWNTWMAMRYRMLIPGTLFDQLVTPWVAVIGPLPDA